MRASKARLPFAIALAAAALAGATGLHARPAVNGAQEIARGAPGTVTAGAFTLDVLTYNLLLKPFVPDRQDERMPLMAAQLGGHDVLLLQEAFSDWHRVRLLRDLRGEYPYQSRILGQDRGLAQDGGVVIVSKWPIEAQFQRLFGDLCQGRDCLADKGVLYARINKQGRRVHIFATHLQSGSDTAATREKQLAVIGRLIDEMALPADEPVLIGGDLNVDRLAGTGTFAAMTRILNARHPAPPGGGDHEPSWDPERNPLVGTPPARYLDYVLYSAAHLRPSAASNAVRRIAAQGKPLSDHFAVHGRFVFDLPARPPRPGTFAFVEFFDGDDPQDDFVCNVSLEQNRSIDLRGHPECRGAKVRSFRLRDLPAGRVIRFYDGASRDGDWTELVPKRFLASERFASFETNQDDARLRMTYFPRNGLDGQVARIEVSSTPTAARLDLE